MDMRCPRCAEPWDNYEFHEAAKATDTSYKEQIASFQRLGCVSISQAMDGYVVDETTSPICERDPKVAGIANALAEIMGDDTDGIMSGMEDAEALGYL